MLENALAILLAYKKELVYLAVFLLGFCFSLLLTPDCNRQSVCLDDIKSKEAAFKLVEDLKIEHIKELREQEDKLKKQCKLDITEALEQKDSSVDSLNCMICKNLLLQCK